MVGDQRIELRWRAFTEPAAPRASPEPVASSRSPREGQVFPSRRTGGLHGNQTRLTPWTVELPRQMHRRPSTFCIAVDYDGGFRQTMQESSLVKAECLIRLRL
jgi:hypothetical protein